MKKISNFIQISCPYINFPQGSSGHLLRIKLRNTYAQQGQPAKSEKLKFGKLYTSCNSHTEKQAHKTSPTRFLQIYQNLLRANSDLLTVFLTATFHYS